MERDSVVLYSSKYLMVKEITFYIHIYLYAEEISFIFK